MHDMYFIYIGQQPVAYCMVDEVTAFEISCSGAVDHQPLLRLGGNAVRVGL